MSKGADKEYGVLSHCFKHRQEAISLTLGWNTQIPGNNWSQEHSKQAVLRRQNCKEDAGLSLSTGVRQEERRILLVPPWPYHLLQAPLTIRYHRWTAGAGKCVPTKLLEAGDMAQQLRMLVDLPKDSGSIPNTHMELTIIYNYNSRGFDTLWSLRALHCTDTHAGKASVDIK